MKAQEKRARELVYARSGGVCECCGTQRAAQWHHRMNRSQGGLWVASNGMHVCIECHGWITTNPTLACLRGWAVRSWQDPLREPALIHGHQVLLDDEGRYVLGEAEVHQLRTVYPHALAESAERAEEDMAALVVDLYPGEAA